jgi:hypothetical protein
VAVGFSSCNLNCLRKGLLIAGRRNSRCSPGYGQHTIADSDIEEMNLERGPDVELSARDATKRNSPRSVPTIEAVTTSAIGSVRARVPLVLTRGSRGKNSDGRRQTRPVLRIVRELGERVGLAPTVSFAAAVRHHGRHRAIDVVAALPGLDRIVRTGARLQLNLRPGTRHGANSPVTFGGYCRTPEPRYC